VKPDYYGISKELNFVPFQAYFRLMKVLLDKSKVTSCTPRAFMIRITSQKFIQHMYTSFEVHSANVQITLLFLLPFLLFLRLFFIPAFSLFCICLCLSFFLSFLRLFLLSRCSLHFMVRNSLKYSTHICRWYKHFFPYVVGMFLVT
jgi:hypothetical protein